MNKQLLLIFTLVASSAFSSLKSVNSPELRLRSENLKEFCKNFEKIENQSCEFKISRFCTEALPLLSKIEKEKILKSSLTDFTDQLVIIIDFLIEKYEPIKSNHSELRGFLFFSLKTLVSKYIKCVEDLKTYNERAEKYSKKLMDFYGFSFPGLDSVFFNAWRENFKDFVRFATFKIKSKSSFLKEHAARVCLNLKLAPDFLDFNQVVYTWESGSSAWTKGRVL